MKNDLMKKVLAVMLALTMAAGISGCGSSEEDVSAASAAPENKAETSSAAEESSESSESDETETADSSESSESDETETADGSEDSPNESESPSEPEVDVKAMLENYDTASVVFEMDTDISSLFVAPNEKNQEWLDPLYHAFPDFSIEEVNGVSMVKISTDKTYEQETSMYNEEKDEMEQIMVTQNDNMVFDLNMEALLGDGDYDHVNMEFLVKNKTGDDEDEVYTRIDSFYYEDYFNFMGAFEPLELENGYCTKSVYYDSLRNETIYIRNVTDQYDVYLADIQILDWNGNVIDCPNF